MRSEDNKERDIGFTMDLESKSITPDEVQACLRACTVVLPHFQGEKWKLYFQIMWETGLRPSEVLQLKVEDFAPDKVKVVRLKKRKKIEDYVPIQTRLYYDVMDYTSRNGIKGRLFPHTLQAATYVFNKIKQYTGIRQHLTLHSFRHGFAFNYLRQSQHPSIALPQLQRLLAHTNINTTMVYLKPGFTDLSKEIQKRQFYDDSK